MSTSIYIQNNLGTQYSFQNGLTGTSTVYIPPGQTGTWLGVAERFGYQRQSVSFEPALGGDIPFSPIWVQDVFLTVTNLVTVAGYTALADLSKVYDFNAYWRTTNSGIPHYLVVKNGTVLDFGTASIIVDALAANVFTYNSATNTFTIKASELNSTALFSTIKAASITTVNGAVLKCLYQTSIGTSARLNYADLLSSQILLLNQNNIKQDYQTNKTGQYIQYIQPGATGIWKWVVEKYGYIRQSSVISLTSGNGGDFNALLSYAVDTNITQLNSSTVGAYTVISDLSQLHDYDAYWRTTETGIFNKLITVVGSVIDFGLTKIVIDNAAPNVYSYDELDDIVTIRSVVLAASSKFTAIKGKIIMIAPGSSITAVYESEAGASSSLVFNNLNNSSIFVFDDNNVEIDFQSGLTGNFTESLPPGNTGIWSWVSTTYAKVRQQNTFTPATGGNFNAVSSLVSDFIVTEQNPTIVSAYTQFTSLDQIYDYFSYWQTTEQGIFYNLFSNVGGTLMCTAALVCDQNATTLWSYSSATDTLTIKAGTIAAGTKNTQIQADDITFANGSKMTCLYTTSLGTSVNLVFKGLQNSAIQVLDELGAVVDFQTDLTGIYTVYIEPGNTGDWKWTAERYTYTRQAGIVTPAQGGVIPVNLSWIGDTTAFDSNLTQVAALVNLNDPQKVNDYEAYWRTTEGGIGISDTVSRNADSLDFGSYSVVIDPTLPSPYDVVDGVVYLKATNLVANIISTTGTVELANGAKVTGVISDTTGTSSQLTINGLTGCSVAVFNQLYEIYDFVNNKTDSYDLSVPSDFTGNWTYVITKFGRTPITGIFTLGQSVATIVTYNEKIDARVFDTNLTSVSAYTTLNSTQQMYDYFSYWSTSQEGILWHSVVGWSGSVLNCGAANLTLDPNALQVAHVDEVTHLVTIKIDSNSLSGDLITTGSVTRLNGALTTGLVTDSTGTTAIITFSGFTGTNKLYVQDDLGALRLFTTVTTNEYVLYLLPQEQTSNDWIWSTKKTGFQHTSGEITVIGGGRIPIQVGVARILQPDGSQMFTTAGIPSTLTIDWTTSGDNTPRILLGDQQYYIQDIYNAVDTAMSTLDGLKWIAKGNSDVRIAILPAGNFIFLSTGWRFRVAIAGSSNSSVNGFAISTDAKSIDSSNGPVSLLSASGALAESKIAELDFIYERIKLLPELEDLEASLILAREASVKKAITAASNAPFI